MVGRAPLQVELLLRGRQPAWSERQRGGGGGGGGTRRVSHAGVTPPACQHGPPHFPTHRRATASGRACCASCADTLWSKKKSTVIISAGMSAAAIHRPSSWPMSCGGAAAAAGRVRSQQRRARWDAGTGGRTLQSRNRRCWAAAQQRCALTAATVHVSLTCHTLGALTRLGAPPPRTANDRPLNATSISAAP